MKFLGVDYGSKKIGLAVSDDGGQLAFPYKIIRNTKKTIDEIIFLCLEKNIRTIIVGKSDNLSGLPNKIQNEIENFTKILKDKGFIIESSKEFLTSSEARWSKKRAKPVANLQRSQKNTNEVDASAAALILQRYLDRLQLKSND